MVLYQLPSLECLDQEGLFFLIQRGLEIMQSLVGTRYFSTMDLKSRFWQVKMLE